MVGMMELEHKNLVKLAERWLLKSRGCGFVLTELRTYADEIPDAIGFRDGETYLVECKTSRSDFLADQKKRFRVAPELGMGTFRYYLCMPGVINPEDLPAKWGLLHVKAGCKVRQIVGPKARFGPTRAEYMFTERNTGNEMRMLYSALRRLHLRGVLSIIYEKPWEKSDET
jgi:hypothetical protein